MSDNQIKMQAFKLKGRLYTFTVLHLLKTDPALFTEQLLHTVAQAPKLFERTPVVFDLSAVQEEVFDLESLCKLARDNGLLPVAIQGGNPLQDTIAQCQGLAVFHASSTQDKALDLNTTEQARIKTKVVNTPVRSGQQVVAKGANLVVTASVSHGAELLADGSIHVYGALRGRALAGISGDVESRIFCQSLEAELVSIAGYYRLSDAIEPQTKPCQIYLLEEHIHIESL